MRSGSAPGLGLSTTTQREGQSLAIDLSSGLRPLGDAFGTRLWSTAVPQKSTSTETRHGHLSPQGAAHHELAEKPRWFTGSGVIDERVVVTRLGQARWSGK